MCPKGLLKMFLVWFLIVSRVFQGRFKHISRESQEFSSLFQKVPSMFQKVSRMFQDCFKGFQGRKFQRSCNEVSRVSTEF